MNGVSAAPAERKRTERSSPSGSFRAFSFFVTGLAVLFLKPLIALATIAARSQLHSHILLIPFVFIYLIYIRRADLPGISRRSISGSLSFLVIGLAAIGTSQFAATLSASEHLAAIILAVISFIVAGGFFFLGSECMRTLAFPFAFLIFLVPLPERAVYLLETASQVASADAADLFFHLSMTPILREGMVFQLPGMVIEVAQECSGIRSSVVLFMTSLVVAHLFLHTPWRRVVLVAFVIPLGILRNGFRIVVIGLLCVHYGPQMINSAIHLHGGPVFFVLSLIPLFALLYWLRRGDRQSQLRTNSASLGQ